MTTNGLTAGSLTQAIGVRGLSVWAGIVREEYLALLADWHKASRIYLEMLDDVTIGTLLDAIQNPLLAADFDVIPAGDSQADAAAATFLWENMNGMVAQSWRSHVADMLESLAFGFAIGEIVLEKREDGRLWLRNIEPRGQETLDRWEFEGDTATAFVQRDPVTGQRLRIPLARCVHVTFRGRKGNPQGKGLLRSLFRPWRFLKNLENFEGIGIERDVGGTPVAQFDTDLYQGWSTSQLKELVGDALEGLRMDELVYLLAPPGVTITPYASGQKAYDIRAVIQAKQKEIFMRFFAQFIYLGMETVGTQALVRGQQDFFSLGLRAIQQQLLEAWQQQLVSLLFRFNTFPGLTGVPVITWADPGKVDVAALLDSYGKGINARVLTPIEEDEQHIRAMLDLPDLPEGAREAEQQRRTAQQAMLPALGGP